MALHRAVLGRRGSAHLRRRREAETGGPEVQFHLENLAKCYVKIKGWNVA